MTTTHPPGMPGAETGPASRSAGAPDVRSAVLARRSCRAFLQDPLDRRLVEDLVSGAGRSASWCNTQPWLVHVCDTATTAELRTFLAEGIPGARTRFDVPAPDTYSPTLDLRRRESGRALLEAVGVERSDTAARRRQGWLNFRFFDAPHVVVVCAERSARGYGVLDAGAWVTTFQLLATAAGIGSVAQGAPAAYSTLLRTFFSVPESHDVVCTVAFGLPDVEHPANGFRTSRDLSSETVRWRWDGE